MDIKKIIGLNIREYRDLKGISQETLAHLSDVDRTYIFSIEKGRRNVSILVLFKISKALDVSIHDLLKNIEDEL